jgi:hypothetical protein
MSQRGIKRLTKPMVLSEQKEVDEYVRQLARHLAGLLPPGVDGSKTCGFFLLLTEFGEKPDGTKHDTNYVANVNRADAIRMLRETADRLEKNQTRRAFPDARDYPSDN